MRPRSAPAFFATVVVLAGACTGTLGETNPPSSGGAVQDAAPDAGDEPAGRASDAGAANVSDTAAPEAPEGSVDGGLADAGGGAPCPAPSPDPKQFVVFGDATAAGWSDYGFSGPTTQGAAKVCSGTEAVSYTTSHQYDGFSFTAKTAVPADHFSARIYVSTDSDWTVAAEPLPSSDPHCYRLPLATCGEGDPACGSGQALAPCMQHWKAGWQDVELAIPGSTVTVGAILFEQFSVGSIHVVIDDVRLTQP